MCYARIEYTTWGPFFINQTCDTGVNLHFLVVIFAPSQGSVLLTIRLFCLFDLSSQSSKDPYNQMNQYIPDFALLANHL